MASYGTSLLILAILTTSCHCWSPWHDPHMVNNRSVIVQMFEWRHDDIGEECETFLGPYGYGGVQVSPVQEHIIITSQDGGINQPWYQMYQSVSYKLTSRSGNETTLRNMISKCNQAGVRVYVDIVVNHMTAGGSGIGSAGSNWDGDNWDYPGVPFNRSHFNTKENCGSIDGGIHDFEDWHESRMCELVGLHDLDQSQEYVQNKQVDFMNSILKLGAAGFRVDASKHMYVHTIKSTFEKLINLDEKIFGSGKKPFMYHEVSATGGAERGIKVMDYVPVGKVLNFKYMHNLRDVVFKRDGQLLRYLKNFGQPWGLMPSEDNVPIVDNHDLQRSFAYEGRREGSSFRTPRQMKIANAFMLAWPYGTPKVMSSYEWEPKIAPSQKYDNNSWVGPPHDEQDNYVIKRVIRNPDLSCSGGWICEHRWRQIYGMVGFRNTVGDAPIAAWWDNGYHAIAFAREGKGFILLNNEDFWIDTWLDTTLPAGTYCDVISGKLENNNCTGKKVEVQQDGRAKIIVDDSWDSILAIHVNAYIR